MELCQYGKHSKGHRQIVNRQLYRDNAQQTLLDLKKISMQHIQFVKLQTEGVF